MKKAPGGSYKKLLFNDLAMQKNIYKHFFAFNIGLKNGGSNKFNSDIYTENCTGNLRAGI
jgi:hypothetical protein